MRFIPWTKKKIFKQALKGLDDRRAPHTRSPKPPQSIPLLPHFNPPGGVQRTLSLSCPTTDVSIGRGNSAENRSVLWREAVAPFAMVELGSACFVLAAEVAHVLYHPKSRPDFDRHLCKRAGMAEPPHLLIRRRRKRGIGEDGLPWLGRGVVVVSTIEYVIPTYIWERRWECRVGTVGGGTLIPGILLTVSK